MTTPVVPERAALSRELSEFLIELSIALHKHSMYPDGHPSLAPAAGGVVRRAARLLQDRPTVSLGVARDQLVIEGVATDPKHPVLSELAGRLHRHHLAAITFSRGLGVAEVLDALRVLAQEADRSGQPLGLGPKAQLEAWEHIRLHSLSYDRLEMLNERGEKGPEGDPMTDERVRGARLWVGLARAALAGQIKEDEDPPSTPAVIAQAIDAHARGEAYDQVIVGYLLQIAEELKTAGGAEALELRRRTSRLLAGMREETLKRLLDMGGDAAQRRKFAFDAASGMAVDAVLEVVKAVSESTENSVSHSLMRMLSKMAAHAEQGAPMARPLADVALRDQVKALLSGWNLEDPNPTGYGGALRRMSRAAPMFAVAADQQHPLEPERVVQMSLEVDAVGPNVWRACAQLVDTGRLSQLLDLLENVPTETDTLRALWERAASPDTARWVLAVEPVDFALFDRLLPRVGQAVADPLLDALADAESRTTRRAALERLLRLGTGIGPFIAARLADERWYVRRNLLALLDAFPELPDEFSALPHLSDPDVRVRLEAFKLALKVPAERDAGIAKALGDTDGRLVRTALIASGRSLPADAVPLVLRLVQNPRVAQDVRLQAIRVLGAAEARPPEALELLLRLTDGGRTFFGRHKFPAKSAILVAALSALASGWGDEPRATAILARAAVSNDADIRAATDPGSRQK